jgi:hypothetical protein
MWAIRKVTSGDVNKTSNEKKLLYVYTKNTYILKLFLNYVTAGIETLVSGNTSKSLYACIEEVCRL